MRRLVAVLAAVALVTTGFLVSPGLAQDYGDEDDQGDQAQDQQQDQQDRSSDRGADQRPEQAMGAEDRRQWAQEKRQQALDRAEQAGLFGELTYENGQVNGTFVEADLDEDTGTVSDHTLLQNNTSATVIESFAPDADPDGEVETRPSTVHLSFADGALRLHDNPTGLIQLRTTAPANVSVQIADGYDVTVNENATKARIKGEVNASLLLTGDGDLSEDGGTLEASLDEAGGVLFQAQPDSPGEQVSQRALEHAAEQDKLGGEVRVAGAAGEPVNQSTPST